MNKKIVLTLAVSITLLVIIIFTLVIISFKVVKQSTDKINFALKNDLQTVVRIPDVIPPESKSFTETTYIWEMETQQGEITKVKLVHDTGFAKEINNINVALEMPPGGDPSIFEKVLPAVVSDRQTTDSVTDSQKINLSANSQTGYNSIQLFADEKSKKIVKIKWEYNKNFFEDKHKDLYGKIYSYPQALLESLYKLQRGILLIFSV